MNNAAPHDMLRYFGIGAEEEDELKVIQIGTDEVWVTCRPEPFFPDATLLVVLYTRGLRRIAVQYEDRVTEFNLKDIILRDGQLTGVDR